MKILLINPNRFSEPSGRVAPLAMDYLEGPLRQAGHELKLVDLCFAPDSQLFPLIGTFTPDVVGITIRNIDANWPGSPIFPLELRGLLKQLKAAGFRNIVLGGAGFTVAPKAIMAVLEEADLGVAGDGEVAFVSLLEEIRQGKKEFRTPGVLYRGRDGIVENPREFVDIEQLPPRTRTLVDSEKYFRSTLFLGVQTKRWCPMQCSYCMDPVVTGRKQKGRLHTPAQVADEFELLASKGVTNVWLTDAEFNLPPEHALAVCKELIRRKNKVKWDCPVRALRQTVSEELVSAMKEAGCQEANMAVDSISPKVAELNGFAAQTRESVLEATRLLQKYGIVVQHGSCLGLPGQGPAEVKEIVEFTAEANPDLAYFFAYARIFPGSPLETMAIKEGVLSPDWDPLELVFYKPEYVAKELIPVVRPYLRTHRNWHLQDYSFPIGELMGKFVEDKGVRGSMVTVSGNMFKHPLWLMPKLLRHKIQSWMSKS